MTELPSIIEGRVVTCREWVHSIVKHIVSNTCAEVTIHTVNISRNSVLNIVDYSTISS